MRQLTVAIDTGEIDWTRASKAVTVDLKLYNNRSRSYTPFVGHWKNSGCR
jgi:hypothetical protein